MRHRQHPQNVWKSRRSQARDNRVTLGFLNCAIGHSDMQLVWSGAHDVTRGRQANLIFFNGGVLRDPRGFHAQANVVYDLVNSDLLDGLIVWLSAIDWASSPTDIAAFLRRYHPLLMVCGEKGIEGIPGILFDNYQGMHDVLRHLIEAHGHRRIAFIRGPEHHVGAQERYRAYTEIMAQYDALDLNLVGPPGPWEERHGADTIALLLDQRQVTFDAVVGACDDFAIGALDVLQARGIAVPERIAVAGFDDYDGSKAVTPPLTTARPPFYQMGRQAAETLLAVIAGDEPPTCIISPVTVVIRQSCGCVNPAVITAGAGIVERPLDDGYSSEELVMPQNTLPETLIPRMQEMLDSSEIETEHLRALVAAFITDLRENSPDNFLSGLEFQLRQMMATGNDVSIWQAAISAFRRAMRPILPNAELLARAEGLWHQARVMIGEMAQRFQAAQLLRADRQAQALSELEQALIATFDMPELMNILAEGLPRLGIPQCCLAVYVDPAQPQGEAQLILAYHETGRIPLGHAGRVLPSSRLVPETLLRQDRPTSMIVEALYFQDIQIGIVCFEANPHAGKMYAMLRGEISSALRGALLVERIHESAVELTRQHAELVRQQYILDTFMATVPDAIYFKDRAGRMIRANHAHARRFGFRDPTDELGKTDFDLFPEALAREKYAQEQAVMASGDPLVNQEEPDDQGRWTLTTKMPLRDEHGAIIGTFGISRDITALKQAEQELRHYQDHLADLVAARTAELARSNTLLHAEILERRRAETALTDTNTRLHTEILERRRVEESLRFSEQQYRLLAENVQDGIVIVQAERLVFANAVFAAMMGYDRADLLKVELAQIFQASAKPEFAAWLASPPDPSVSPKWQAELVARDGRTVWTELERAPMVWNSQPAILLTIRDITDRKRREQRLEEERARLQLENVSLKSTIKERYRFGELVGKSPAMQRVYELILNAAGSEVNLLVVGESGTGKELIAQTLHQVSRRKAQAFVPVNCASIPETLFEREFFGHRKGAFTGADRDTPGVFDKAHRGTLFLDEVTELTPATQAKLLRVLQDGQYTPLGSTTIKQADVLIVAATNKNCQEEIARGNLRKDFFYRIGVIELAVPPLRDRKDDLPLLIEHILEQYGQRQFKIHGSLPETLPTDHGMLPGELVRMLYAYDWPGNVRELQNVLQRYLVTGDLQAVLSTLGGTAHPRWRAPLGHASERLTLPDALHALEQQMIAEAWERTQHHIGKTAEELGMPRRTLQNKLIKYQLR